MNDFEPTNTELTTEMKTKMIAELNRLDKTVSTLNRTCTQASENIVKLQNTLKLHILSTSNIQDRITQNTQRYIEYCLMCKEFAEKYMALANAEAEEAEEAEEADEVEVGANASEAGIVAEASAQLAKAALDDIYIQARNMSAGAYNSKPLITDDKCLLKTCKNNIVETTQQINDAIIYEKNSRIKYMKLLEERGCLIEKLYV